MLCFYFGLTLLKYLKDVNIRFAKQRSIVSTLKIRTVAVQKCMTKTRNKNTINTVSLQENTNYGLCNNKHVVSDLINSYIRIIANTIHKEIIRSLNLISYFNKQTRPCVRYLGISLYVKFYKTNKICRVQSSLHMHKNQRLYSFKQKLVVMYIIAGLFRLCTIYIYFYTDRYIHYIITHPIKYYHIF